MRRRNNGSGSSRNWWWHRSCWWASSRDDLSARAVSNRQGGGLGDRVSLGTLDNGGWRWAVRGVDISGDRSRGQDRSRGSSPSWVAGGDSAGAVSDGNGLRSSCGVGLSSLGEGGSLWAVSGVDVGGDRSRGVVGSVPTATPSLNSGDEAQGREKRCEGLHVDG